MTDKKISSVCEKFCISGEYKRFETVRNGHINNTFIVYFDDDGRTKDYIVQKLNTYVFKNPVEVMENITEITEFIRNKIKESGSSAKRYVLHYKRADNGAGYYIDEEGGFWRCCRYIDDSVTFDAPDKPEILFQAGKAFGEFQRLLADYPVKSLFITIPHFHNTVNRYKIFKNSIEANAAGRRDEIKDIIEEYLGFEDVATGMYKMQIQGKLPLRVTHNDTKCNNVLFDKTTLEHLAVIDLDTVMPGLAAFDFGDAIRFGANTCAEDERNTAEVKLDFDKYEAFTSGFVSEIKDSLTDNEKKTLALGAVTMSVECGMRFLTDYLDGDKYFKIDYADHNLIRSGCQLALAKNMLQNLGKMQKIVEKYC